MSAAEFLAIADVLPEPMALVDTTGQLIAVNQSFVREFGESRAALAERALSTLTVDSQESLQDYLQRCARVGQMMWGVLNFRSPDGAPRRYRCQGAACRPAAGAPATARCVVLRLVSQREGTSSFVALNEQITQLNAQITRRQRVEEELRTQREMLQVTLASIGDAVIVTDAQGRVSFLNAVAEELTGWPLEAARGHALPEVFEIVNESTRLPVENPVEKVLQCGHIIGLANHTVLIGRDGREHPIDDSAAPIRTAGGELFGVVLIFRDITERKRAENELLDQARRKDEFLATLAHELRNPLSPIRNALAILRITDAVDPRVQSARDIIDRQVRHMTRLVDDLLDVSRITSGRINLTIEPLRLESVLTNALEASRPAIEAAGHSFQLTPPADALYVLGDNTRLIQIFANLLNNAAKFTAGSGTITVSVERDGQAALISVRDEGIGIPPEMLPRIFDLFTQVNRSYAGNAGGLGIGLTIVKKLLELQCGRIEAHSEGKDRGSTFKVWLPLASASESDDEAALESPAASVETAPTRRFKILIADDNTDSAQSLSVLLKLLGHETHTAHDGLAALALAERVLPDVVLLDIGMPHLDGYETARRLRQTPHGEAVLLIALTGWGQTQDKERARAAGFDQHLVKPADPEVLTDLMRAARRKDSSFDSDAAGSQPQ